MLRVWVVVGVQSMRVRVAMNHPHDTIVDDIFTMLGTRGLALSSLVALRRPLLLAALAHHHTAPRLCARPTQALD